MILANYFDILGVFAFLFLLIFNVYIFFNFRKIPKWMVIFAIIICILGLIVDIYVVFGSFLLRH